jgi:hypothetical protein
MTKMVIDELVDHVAETLANQIAMRKGCPPIRGCLALMPPEMAARFRDDARAAIEATPVDKHLETVAMLKRTVAFLEDVTTEFPHWGEAEELLTEANEFLARIDVGKMVECRPGEEPF